jgi:Na+/proline symporter
MHLSTFDWLIVLASLLICFGPALFFGNRAGRSTSEFSPRPPTWWLAGLSMVATTFSADTPNLVTDIVRRNGVAGNWVWWAFVLTGVATVFFYARLWRRSGVLTDLEFYELRYSGAAASALRGFRAVYLGLFFNCMIMAAVNLATCKIAGILFGLDRWQTLLLVGILNVTFAAFAGLWGVLVIDMIQFFMKMTAVIAAAYFAVTSAQVGGLHGLVTKVSAMHGPGGLNYLGLLPDFKSNWDLAVAVFIMPIAVQWWAVWYPGSEPAEAATSRSACSRRNPRRMRSARSLLQCCPLRVPAVAVILVALCSLIVYPELSDIQKAFPNLEPRLLGHDIAYPAMLTFLPHGFLGLMVGGLIAASSSTILTHLNWGASYLVHDFYRRFVKPNADERHYVRAGRIATAGLFVGAAVSVYLLDTAKDIFDVILQVGAGTGLLYLVRWFWWRVNAWCEVVAMVSSFAVSVVLLVLAKNGVHLSTHTALLVTIAVTTVSWVATAFLGPETDRAVLASFYEKVRPFGPGWEAHPQACRREAERGRRSRQHPARAARMGLRLHGDLVGALCRGNYLYGRYPQALLLTAIFAVSSIVLARIVQRTWTSD